MNWFTWTPLELSANFFIATCIFLAGRNNVHTWWTGIVGSVLYAVLFYQSKLYADVMLQFFFVATGFIGWWNWELKTIVNTVTKIETPINYSSTQYMGFAVVLSIVTAGAYGYMLHSFTDAYAPWIDSTVLTFSIAAQFLLMRRSIQTWHIWVLVNTLSVPLFWSRELYLTSIMYTFFWFNAVYSLFHWKNLFNNQKTVEIQ